MSCLTQDEGLNFTGMGYGDKNLYVDKYFCKLIFKIKSPSSTGDIDIGEYYTIKGLTPDDCRLSFDFVTTASNYKSYSMICDLEFNLGQPKVIAKLNNPNYYIQDISSVSISAELTLIGSSLFA